jgi:hypothetical protein
MPLAGKDSTRLKPIFTHAEPPGGAVVLCDIVAHAAIQASPDEVRNLRQNLTLPSGDRLPPAFVKQSEDQTATGIAAVSEALRRNGLTESVFSSWGVLGAPRHLGRVAMSTAIEKMRVEGAWGISPHLIPHRLLHALSGAVSLAFRFRGPNFGVGGGPNGVQEALLAAAAMLEGARLPGLWVVLTGFDPEPDTRAKQAADQTSRCNALALALVAARPDWQGPRLRVTGKCVQFGDGKHLTGVRLESLIHLMQQWNDGPSNGRRAHVVGEGIALEWAGISSVLPAPKSFGAKARPVNAGEPRRAEAEKQA